MIWCMYTSWKHSSIKFTDTSVTSRVYHFWWGHLHSILLANFNYSVLSSAVTVFHIRSSDLIQFCSWSFAAFYQLLPISLPPLPLILKGVPLFLFFQCFKPAVPLPSGLHWFLTSSRLSSLSLCFAPWRVFFVFSSGCFEGFILSLV